MNRKPRTEKEIPHSSELLYGWRQHLLSRRRFLITAASGSIAAMFPLSSLAADTIKQKKIEPWLVIDAVQQHLFPVEDKAPGAREVNALGYLQFVVTDATLDAESREFITKGATWLEGMAHQIYKTSFVDLDNKQGEKVLRRIAASEAGENWLATLMLYIVEALLTDPVYGGNTDQRGWQWLQHVPGFPRPPLDKTFPRLLSRDTGHERF